jgi:diguanylate cyclase (GGDEF)-like protein
MHSVNLLVTDRSPESAEHINSLLRNSGIKVHVLHAESSTDVKRILDNDAPVLILYADADETDAPLEEIGELAASCNVPLAFYADLADGTELAKKMASTACFVINSEREDLLVKSVTRLVRNRENEQEFNARQQYLEELEHRYKLLLESSRDAIAYVHEGLHVYANRAYLEALRIKDESEIAGLSLLEILKAEGTDLKKVFKGLSRGEFPGQSLEVEVTRPDQSTFEASLEFSPARFEGEDCTQMMMQRKDAANELAAELERMRHVDPLTQFHNRRKFAEAVEAVFTADGNDTTAAVLYFEPDGFAALQEELSADSSDEFIADFANILRGCLGPDDTPARISDHSLAVLAERSTSGELETLAQDVLKAYRSHIVEIGDRAISASCSVGICHIGRLSKSASEIIANARKAMLEAAQSGDQLTVYRPQLTAVDSPSGEQDWAERIKIAMANQDLYTVQQSIVDLDGEGEQLVENTVFLRGEDQDFGPADYLEAAEQADLAGAMDRHVIPGLLKTFVDSSELQIINLSSNSILDYAFPGWFAEQVQAACVDGSKLVLQIASNAAYSNLRPAQRLMKELQPLGCSLSVCRFDAELRTLQLLDHLDANYIKLKTSLTRDLLSSTRDQEAVRKIVDAADPKGIDVIAEEVADTSSLAVLWQCGVKLVAGAFLSDSSQVIAQ